jgi:AcrR family transcriptional regulator
MSSGVGEKRAYDSRRRRERAEAERGETKTRVVEAAARLFVEQGYTRTTMGEIARAAGVAVQSVYNAAAGKADLLHLVVDRAVAGDGRPILVHDRPVGAAIAAESDPEQQVRMIADAICEVQERSAPIQLAYREAAAVDPTIAASVNAAHLRRLESFNAFIRMVPAERLRCSPERAAETMWAIGSSEVFLLMRNTLGWDAPKFRAWLGQTLVDQLLAEDAPPPAGG